MSVALLAGSVTRSAGCTLKMGAQQVLRLSSTNARCRVVSRAGGCSLSTRRPNQRRTPPPPGSRSPAAYKPLCGPPPAVGDSAIAASTVGVSLGHPRWVVFLVAICFQLTHFRIGKFIGLLEICLGDVVDRQSFT